MVVDVVEVVVAIVVVVGCASKVRLAEPFLAYLLLVPHTASAPHHDLTPRLLL